MNNNQDISNITNFSSLSDYLSNSAYRHTCYYHYSSIDAIDSILMSKQLWISSMLDSNDNTEKFCFGENTYTHFQLCFSTGTTENLPLWFLYSGKNGQGARITFSRKGIKSLIDPRHMKLTLLNITTGERTSLFDGQNCQVEFRDILYAMPQINNYRIKHNNKINNEASSDMVCEYLRQHKGFSKGLIWFYEKETRLMVTVNPLLIERSLFKNGEKAPYRIELDIPPESFKNISITLSPQYGEENSFEVEKIWLRQGFKKFIVQNCLSEYAGQINIDLCKNCKG